MDIKVRVSKPVHRSRSTNQGCAQRSQDPCNVDKLYYFVLQNLYYFMIVVLTKAFFIYLLTMQITPGF